MNKDNILNDEKDKYEIIHKLIRDYGYKTMRKSWFNGNGKFFQMVDSILKNSHSVLDVGCGKGNFFEYLSKKYPGIDISGIDISPSAVESCVSKGMKCFLASASEIPFEDVKFDAVYHFDGFEHIPREIEVDVLSEQTRVSKMYIIHQIALLPSLEDPTLIKLKKTPLHINLKTHKEWMLFFNENIKNLNFKIIHEEIYKKHSSIILQRINN